MTDIDKLVAEITDRTYHEGPLTGPNARRLAARLGILEGERRGMEKAAEIADGFNVTPAFDLPCSPFDRTEAIAEAIRDAKP